MPTYAGIEFILYSLFHYLFILSSIILSAISTSLIFFDNAYYISCLNAVFEIGVILLYTLSKSG